MTALASVILAAGKGKRMRSDLPKVLHPFAGARIIDFVLTAASGMSPQKLVVVVGHQAHQVETALRDRKVEFAHQTSQLGTGHAVMQARDTLAGFSGSIVVIVGDVPLLRTETLKALLQRHREQEAHCTLLTAEFAFPAGYGRIVRSPEGDVEAIVEHKDASPEEQAIKEINSGIMIFEAGNLWQHIGRLSRGNAQAEYYLTDLVKIYREAGLRVAAYCVADEWEVHGINSGEQLAELERIYRERHPVKGERD